METHSLQTKRSCLALSRNRAMTLILLITGGCSVAAQAGPRDDTIAILSRPDNAAALGSMRLVVKDSAAYQRVWSLAWSRNVTPPNAPQVDFSRYDVVVIAAGGQSITGGRIEITKFEDDAAGRTYYVALTVPGPGCLGGTMMIYNALFARVPKGSGIPIFHDTLSAPRCE